MIFSLKTYLDRRKTTGSLSALSSWPFVVVILTQMLVGGFSVYTLSATRAFVAGESLWSKGQHEAIYFLNLYIETMNIQYLQDFQRAIAVPLDYKKGRDAVEKTPPDKSTTRLAFEAGGTAKEDIPAVIWMFRNFRGFPYLETAIARWKETDRLILELKDLGDAIGPSTATADPLGLLDRLERIDREITPKTIVFSRALDDGARVVERILLLANFALAALLTILTIWRVGKVLKQRRHIESALAWQASHDDLTGLANRRAFEQSFSKISKTNVTAKGPGYALLYIDLDQFKIVNDTCGHAAGDALLRQICAPLQQALRVEDLVSRVGGDEFSVLLPNIDAHEALRSAEQIRGAIEHFSFVWQGRRFGVTASIGLAHCSSATTMMEEIMTQADMACFMAKEKGRNRVHAHLDEDQELLDRIGEMDWVQRIHQALEEDRLCLYGQEIVPLAGGGDAGLHLEILIRMHDETGALVPPSSFIPAAERFGLMQLIDRWVVLNAFKILSERERFANKLPVTCCAINLSGGTIGDAPFLDFLKSAFVEYKISPQTICFEVTETAAIVNLQAARSFIRDLRRLGCTFALDDFGSGMSSFTYLKEIPADYLKIDGAFVRNLLTDRPDRAMVEMISHIGHIMGKQIVAEFVENEEVADALFDIGIDYAQGFGIAPPLPFTAHFEGSATVKRRLPHRMTTKAQVA